MDRLERGAVRVGRVGRAARGAATAATLLAALGWGSAWAAARPGSVGIILGPAGEAHGLLQVGAGGNVGDSDYHPASVAGKSADVFDRNTAAPTNPVAYIYLQVQRSTGFVAGNPSTLYETVEYYDYPAKLWLLTDYNSTVRSAPVNGAYEGLGPVITTGRRQWRKVVFVLTQAALQQKQNYGADLRIDGSPGLAVHSVTLSLVPPKGLPIWSEQQHRVVAPASATGRILLRGGLYGNIPAIAVRGVQAGLLPWKLRGSFVLTTDHLQATGAALVIASGLTAAGAPVPATLVGTTDVAAHQPIRAVAAAVSCAGHGLVTTAAAPLSPSGDFRIDTAVALPSPCADPIVLIGPLAKTKGLAAWFAASDFLRAFGRARAHAATAAGVSCANGSAAAGPNVAVPREPSKMVASIDASCWARIAGTSITKAVIGNAQAGTSAEFKTAWSQAAFYVWTHVHTGRAALINSNTSAPWEDDTVEVYLSGPNDRSGSYGPNTGQILINSGGLTNMTFGGDHANLSTTGAKELELRTAHGYTTLLIMPWSDLGVTPHRGLKLGFTIGVDFPGPGAAHRAAQTMWQGTQNNWDNDTTWGTATLS